MKIFVTTAPFGQKNSLPLEILNSSRFNYKINSTGRRLTEQELFDIIPNYDAVIAGTERISRELMEKSPRLKFISRVGIGVDGIDLNAARDLGVAVSYTPDAPSPAVAELTIGLMLNLLRGISFADSELKGGIGWSRIMGRRLSEVTIGVIGVGRIGARVLRRLSIFGSPRILVNDIQAIPDNVVPQLKLEWCDKEALLAQSDLVSLHVPLTTQTRGMIDREQLLSMKSDAFVINTARGGLINEKALSEVLHDGHLAGAAVDVFEEEPYTGCLLRAPRTLLTCHMGSMTEDCRSRMEIEATNECVRFLKHGSQSQAVPDFEYELQSCLG